MSSLNVACDISGMQCNHASEKYVTSRLNEHRQYDMRMSSADWPTGCFFPCSMDCIARALCEVSRLIYPDL